VKKLVTFILGGLTVAIGWMFFDKFQIRGLDQFRVAPREPSATDARGAAFGQSAAPPVRTGNTIRVATFNIQVFGESKANKPNVMELLARIVRQFDVVAIQEIRARDQDVLPRFVETINAAGRHYDYVIGPRLGRTESTEQFAFVFDLATLEIDRAQLYTVADPDDLLHREPLVGWFRVRGPPPDQAFTFSLVNVHIDPDETATELNVLADVYRAVLHDGRQEDDVIILGDLNVDDRHLGALGQVSGMTGALAGVPTNTRGTHQFDHILFHSRATVEFAGRAGVFDFLREYNLTLDQALEVSDHLPVWAEFSAYEGGQPGRIATGPGSDLR
jgi:endonuclease/exonuclease/phosphatase family metal-dependent hydrolase